MSRPGTTPAGAWPSPLSAAQVARTGTSYGQVALTDEGATAWWTERRAADGGRAVVVRRTGSGPVEQVTPDGFDARTRLHEYGGACWVPTPQGLVSSSWEDQRLHLLAADGPRPLTPDTDGRDRYAEPVLLPGGSHVLAVREQLDPAVRNALVAVPLSGQGPVVELWSGSHFVSSARVGDDGRVAFLTWEHPQMPWDGTQLRVAELLPGPSLGPVSTVLGGPAEAVYQPEWEPDGSLRAVTDASGWWNLVRDGRPLWPVEQECGWPAWVAGTASHARLADGRVAVVHGTATRSMSLLDPEGAVRALDLPFTAWSPQLAAAGSTVLGVAAAPDRGWAVVAVDGADGSWRELAGPPRPDPAWCPVPEALRVRSTGGRPAYAHVYPPTSPDHATATAPYVVFVHGGPTSQVFARYDETKAFWTSRGFGVADVDYGGSTGYGRAYRDSLQGQWGVVDVEDCEAVARELLDSGRASAVVIRGGSAGGWTVLCALTRGSSVFAGGASYFGVADLVDFAATTHDFESRYLDGLVGPLPEAAGLYVERSPVSQVARLDRPTLLLQGLDDKVVPPGQAELMLAGLRERGVPHAYLAFEGEGHGFHRVENVAASLEAELSFYGQVLGFEPPGVPALELQRH